MPQVRQLLLPEIRDRRRRLGRHIVHDERSHDFVAHLSPRVITVNHESKGLPLNQKKVGSCTAEALTAAGNSYPNLRSTAKPRTQKDAYELYHVETVLERQPWPPNDPGGSGLMVCKAAKQLGWIKSYRHAFGIEQALRALVVRPVIFGVSWFDSFDTPDMNGLVEITPRAQVRGGHEICADEIVAEHELVGFWQSWGKRYGPLGGRFYMSFSTVEALLEQQGDCTIPLFV